MRTPSPSIRVANFTPGCLRALLRTVRLLPISPPQSLFPIRWTARKGRLRTPSRTSLTGKARPQALRCWKRGIGRPTSVLDRRCPGRLQLDHGIAQRVARIAVPQSSFSKRCFSGRRAGLQRIPITAPMPRPRRRKLFFVVNTALGTTEPTNILWKSRSGNGCNLQRTG